MIDPNKSVNVPNSVMRPRDDIILDWCRDKKVLHVGCVDHLQLIEDKISEGRYLHSKILSVCSVLHGVDINVDGVRRLRSLGFENIFDCWESVDDQYDVVLVPDVIEHVQNCGELMAQIQNVKSDYYIFTTPNCYRLENRFLFNFEKINSDHRYWHSPFTFVNLLTNSNFEVLRTDLYDQPRKRFPVRTALKKAFPLLRSGLLVICIFR